MVGRGNNDTKVQEGGGQVTVAMCASSLTQQGVVRRIVTNSC